MIKELIFSSKKFYEGTRPNIIGRKIKPTKHPITAWNGLNGINLTNQNYENETPSGTVRGVMATSGNFNGWYGMAIFDGGWWYKVDEIIQNGGVSSSPLSHIRRCLQSLLRNKVIACL